MFEIAGNIDQVVLDFTPDFAFYRRLQLTWYDLSYTMVFRVCKVEINEVTPSIKINKLIDRPFKYFPLANLNINEE